MAESERQPAARAAVNPSPLLGRVLGYGSRISVLVLAVGFAVTLTQSQRGGAGLRPGTLVNALRHGQGTGILGLGIALLICTPIVREATALGLFARHREWVFAALAGIVLTLVLCSALVGAH